MDGNKMDLKETGYETGWIYLAQERDCFIYRARDSYSYL